MRITFNHVLNEQQTEDKDGNIVVSSIKLDETVLPLDLYRDTEADIRLER